MANGLPHLVACYDTQEDTTDLYTNYRTIQYVAGLYVWVDLVKMSGLMMAGL